ncbi:EYxxD motif small membrane protein [Neobacillus sp. OS1-32]
MIGEWVTHTSFVVILLIGSIVAILYAFMRRTKNRARQ